MCLQFLTNVDIASLNIDLFIQQFLLLLSTSLGKNSLKEIAE